MNHLQDAAFTDRFDPNVKGKIAYKVHSNEVVEEVQAMNIYPPRHWDFMYAADRVAPEMRDAWARHDEHRVKVGDKALVCHVGDLYHAWWVQRVDVEGYGPVTFYAETRNKWQFRNSDTYIDDASLTFEDGVLRASVYMHAWSNHNIPGFDHNGNGRCSCGVNCGPVAIRSGEAQSWIDNNIPNATTAMKDAVDNFTMRVGVDPTGGWNPLSDDVVWGEAYHIYNGYAQQLICEVNIEPEPEPPSPEPEPKPEPQPPVKWSKLGPHVLKSAPGLGEHLAAGPYVKLVGDFGHVHSVVPGALVIGRIDSDEMFNAAEAFRAGRDPIERAYWFVDQQRSTYEKNSQIEYWSGPNEQILWGDDIDDEAAMTWYGEFEAARIVALDELGKRAVIGDFSSGAPPLHLWKYFSIAIDVGMEFKAILGVHEYAHPWTFWMTGGFQVDPDEHEGDEGWTTLRYRKVYRQNGFKIPLAITEFGIDALVNPKPEGAPTVQWKGLGDYWKDNHEGPVPYPGNRDDYYADQLIWYDREIAKDKYVVVATVFCWGNFGGEWANFDVANTGVAGRLTEHVAANPPPPFVWEDYVIKEEGDMEKYNRVYVMADPTYMDEEQVSQAYKFGRNQLHTTGPSWQDAVPYAENRPEEWETNQVYAGPMPEEDRQRYIDWVNNRDPSTELIFDFEF